MKETFVLERLKTEEQMKLNEKMKKEPSFEKTKIVSEKLKKDKSFEGKKANTKIPKETTSSNNNKKKTLIKESSFEKKASKNEKTSKNEGVKSSKNTFQTGMKWLCYIFTLHDPSKYFIQKFQKSIGDLVMSIKGLFRFRSI